MSVVDLKSYAHLKSLQSALTGSKRVCVVYFYANWEESSVEAIQVIEAIAGMHGDSLGLVAKVDTQGDDALSLTSKFQVERVPTMICIVDDNVIARVAGYVPNAMLEAVVNAINSANATSAAAGSTSAPVTAPSATASSAEAADAASGESKEAQLESKLRGLVNSSPIMLFMKGSPATPRCGFSRQAVALLQGQLAAAAQKAGVSESEVTFGSFDILTDNEVREGLKKLFNWPTYPQLYIKGELVGGLDVMKELAEGGDLVDSIVSDVLAK